MSHDRYNPYLTVTTPDPLKHWIFWCSGDVLSVKCSPSPPLLWEPPNYTLIQKSILRGPAPVVYHTPRPWASACEDSEEVGRPAGQRP